jgi:L-fuconolactonase
MSAVSSAPRIDAHQHFWRYDPVEYDWIDDRMDRLKRDFLPADLQPELAASGFTACLAVQARQTPDETRSLLALADAHDFIAGVVGWVDLRSPALEDELDALSGHPKLVGVRHIVQSEPGDFLARADVRRGIARLRPFDLVYDVLIYERQFPAAVDFVAAFPDQPFVLDHLGKPDIRHGRLDDWAAQLRAIARHPHVSCKLSGLVTEADWQHWTPAALRPYLETAIDAFGPARLMIGSDWPVCTVAASYRQVVQLVEDVIAGWSPTERDAVLGGTARRVYGLDRGRG